MIHEILIAIEEEVLSNPMRMIAEVVQFLLLVGIAWVAVIGFGKRRGFVANMLAERSQTTADRLEGATQATQELEDARLAAEERLSSAKVEAERLVESAESETTASEQAARAAADAEAQRIVERAHTALANERAQMQADLRDELVGLVSEATRAIMSEALSVAEQRERIERSIVASISTDGDGADEARALARGGVAAGTAQ